MNIKDFEKLCTEFEKKEAELRSVKGKEYATDDVLAACLDEKSEYEFWQVVDN